MRSMRRFAFLGLLSALMMLGLGPSPSMADSRAHVYLLRGLMNIFSLGMDALAEKIQRHGIYATVHNYAEWQSLADRAAAAYKAGAEGPIIIIGHSLGADAVMEMSAYLGRKGVPVALAVPFDAKQSFATPSNVGHLLNLTHGDYGHMSRGPGFHGTLVNVDVSADRSIDHLNIDKSARLHAQVISAILAVVGGEHRSAEPTAHNHHVPDGVAAPAVGSDGVVKPAESTAAPPKPADGENGATKASEAMKPLADSGTPIIAAPEKGGASSRTP